MDTPAATPSDNGEQTSASKPSTAASAPPPPAGGVWAAKAALREKEREAERKKEDEAKKKGGGGAGKPAASGSENGGRDVPAEKSRRDTTGIGGGAVRGPHNMGLVGSEGELVADGPNAQMWIRVNQEYAGFIVGPMGKVINDIAQQTLAHILSPRKGDDSIFFISGSRHSVIAAAALIRVKEQEGKEREYKGRAGAQPETVTDVSVVPESLVGFVMGSQRSVIGSISQQTRTQIVCPVRGGKPEFTISGVPGGSKLTRACTHKACVEAAKACIQARLHQATLGSWQAAQDNTTIYVTVGVERVGLIVGPQGSVIQNIAATTGTSIISPRKGQDPVFVITGTKRAVEAAREIIESKASVSVLRTGGKGAGGKKTAKVAEDAMNRPLIVDGLARGAPP